MEEASNKIVSVIIVTCGRKDYLEHCLDSLKRQTRPPSEIIVIDNSPNPGFGRKISELYPDITLYSGSKNLFYSGALDRGIKMSKGDFILCLNDDVALDKEFTQEALAGFDIDDKVGMVSGKILRPDSLTIDSTGLFLSVWRTARERGYGRLDKGQYDRKGYIFGASGAAAFYRKRMLEAIKVGSQYFDGDYRFFYEDLDIAWRANLLGWKGYYIPKAIAYHVRGASARPLGINKPYARRYLNTELQLDLLKNRYLTLVKNEPALSFFLHLPFIFSYDVLVWVYILFFRPNLIIKSLMGFKYLKSALNKRRIIERMQNETAS